MHNLFDLVTARATVSPDAPALLDTTGSILSYRDLANRLQQIAGAIARSGAQSGDKVAIVLPNGPESAIAFLAV
jgi:mycobactin phenyloxazoline synthetase